MVRPATFPGSTHPLLDRRQLGFPLGVESVALTFEHRSQQLVDCASTLPGQLMGQVGDVLVLDNQFHDNSIQCPAVTTNRPVIAQQARARP